jgi:4-diphosphocytidyl-2-C-methyl-D-erythritol kinase
MPPRSTTEFAPAKVNLSLHVTGQRSDGYHLLDSLVVFCGIGDRITVEHSAAARFTLTGPFAAQIPDGGDNLVMQAVQAFGMGQPFAITLEKNLPVASGLGGGSSDAAATIRAIRRLADHATSRDPGSDADAEFLALGSDVPVCLKAAPMRLGGIGDILRPPPPLPEVHIVLVNPGVQMSTPSVFAALQSKTNAPMPDTLPAWPDAAALAQWLTHQRNDLEPPARLVAPQIGDVLAALSSLSRCLMARMSGSGATCFGLFATATQADTAASQLITDHPDWWVATGPVLTAPA